MTIVIKNLFCRLVEHEVSWKEFWIGVGYSVTKIKHLH
jgi:hypothetical protein